MDGPKYNYMVMLEEMEHNWWSAVEKAMSVREDQLSIAHRAILELRDQTQRQECKLRQAGQEVTALRTTVSELTAQLDSAQEEIVRMEDKTNKILEEKENKHAVEIKYVCEELETTRKDLNDKLKELYKLKMSHEELMKEIKNRSSESLQDLRSQLDMAKEKEAIHHKRILELENTTNDQAKRLNDWNRVSEKMCDELSEMKSKVMGTRYVNGKLKEELLLWKKFCDIAEEERKTLRRDIDLQKRVMNKFNQVEAYLKSEREHRNMTVDALNNFGSNILKEIKNNSKAVRLVTVSCQTEIEEQEKDQEIEKAAKNDWEVKGYRAKVVELEEEIMNAQHDVNDLTQQNVTLRDVIKSMRKEREQLEKDKEQNEEEARLEKLEENMKLLKRSLLSEKKEACVWSALQDVKKEVANLKIKNLNNNKDYSDGSKPQHGNRY